MKRSILYSGILALYALLTMFLSIHCSRLQDDTLEIKTSLIPTAGRGLFTKKFIKKGTCIGYYTGRFITTDEHLRLYRENNWFYVMRLPSCAARRTGGFTLIDGSRKNPFSMINYAPREFQNVVFRKICEPPFVKVIAIRDINAGEELYIDYGPNYKYDFMKSEKVIRFFESKRRTLRRRNVESVIVGK